MTDDKKAEEIATKYPGFINFSGQVNGHYSGAKILSFQSATEINKFFEANQHVIVTGIFPRESEILVVYTTQLDQKDLQYLGEWGEKVDAYLSQRREEDAKLEEEAELIKVKAEAETKELAERGRKCIQHHKKIR